MQKDDIFSKNIALLLDFDGTLVDLADDPTKVVVPPELVDALDRILTRTHTPLAIVTGRQIKVLDEFLELPNLAVSGNHGTEIRPPGSEFVIRRAHPMSEAFRFRLKSLCAEFDCVLEDKNETAVVQTPNDAAFHAVRNELQKLLSEHFQDFALWPVGRTIEIHCRGFSKVTGIQDMLNTREFKGYLPVYIGDDVETYPGFEALAESVHMIPVGQGKQGGFFYPSAVRNFLTQFSNRKVRDNNSLVALMAEFGSLR